MIRRWVLVSCLALATWCVSVDCKPSRTKRDMYCGDDNCYTVLGVSRDATKQEIRKKYRKLSLQWHPDKNPAPEAKVKFTALGIANGVLSKDASRESYDHYLDNPDDYWHNTAAYYTTTYSPKSDWKVVVLSFIAVMTFLQYTIQEQNNKRAMKHVRRSESMAKHANRVFNERLAADGKTPRSVTRNEKEDMIEGIIDELMQNTVLEGGSSKPDIWNMFGVHVALLPWSVSDWLYWSIRWIILFRLLGQDYGPEEVEYLTLNAMGCGAEQWKRLPPQNRMYYMSKELWVKENMAAMQEEQKENYKRQNPEKYKKYTRARKKYQPSLGGD